MPRSAQATVNTRFTATNQMRGTMQRMSQSVRRFGRIATVAVGAAAAATLRATAQFASTGDEIAKMSRELGLGAEALQELRFAADRQGVSTEDLEKALGAMNNRLGQLRQNQGSLSTMLNRSNPQLAEQLKNAEDSEQAFMLMMGALNETEDAADRAALAQAAFGRSGQSLVRVAEAGADGISDLRREAREYGSVISNEAAESSEEFVDGMTNLKNAMQGVRNNALLPLMRNLQPLIQRTADWVAANQDLINQRIQRVFEGIADAGRTIARLWDNGVIPAILAGVVAFKAINAAMAVYHTTVAVAKGAQLAFNAVMAANPIGLVVIAIAAVVAATVALIRNWDTVKQVAQDVWGGIVEYVQGVWDFFKEFFSWLGEVFAPIFDAIGERFTRAFNNMRAVAQAMWSFVSPIFETIGNVIDKVGEFLNSGAGRTMEEGRAANAERYGMTTRNTAGLAQTSRSESTTNNRLDVNFDNMPAGTRARMSGPRNPNIRVNYGAAGGQL